MKYSTLTASLVLSLAIALGGCDDKKKEETKKQEPQAPAAAVSLLQTPKGWGTPSSGATGENSFLTKNYYVIFDGSGSMGDSECSGGARGGRVVPARNAMLRFGTALSPDDNLGLYVFDASGANQRVTLGHGAANRAAYSKAVQGVQADGGTPLGDALYKGYEALREQSLKQNGYGEYHIVVVTDGAASDPSVMNRAVAQIAQTPVVLETIGFCIAEGHALNQPGQTIYRNAMNPTELTRGLAAVLAETEDFTVSNFGASK